MQMENQMESSEYNYTIISIPEIDEMIVNYLDIPKDGRRLMLVNKYYQLMIQENPLYIELHNLRKKKCTLSFSWEKKNLSLSRKFFKACVLGFSKAAKYILDKWIEENSIWVGRWCVCIKKFSLQNDMMQALLFACENNRPNVAKWIYSLDFVNKDTCKSHLEKYFDKGCKKGTFEIIKWIYSLNVFDLGWTNEYLFQICCEHGHLQMAKWFLSIDNTIDIHANDNKAFRDACKNCHLEVAQFLFQLDTKDKFDIHYENDEVIRSFDLMNKLDTLRWYFSLFEADYQFSWNRTKIVNSNQKN